MELSRAVSQARFVCREEGGAGPSLGWGLPSIQLYLVCLFPRVCPYVLTLLSAGRPGAVNEFSNSQLQGAWGI